MKYGLIMALLLAFVAGGCASKKYVRSRIEPVVLRVDAIEGQNKQQADSIEELENKVSLADERAQSADQRAQTAHTKANEAASQAQQAGERAGQAGRTASDAQSLAERGHTRLDEMGRTIENWDKYSLSSETMILFRLESAALDEEAKTELDRAAASIPAGARSVVEVRGFTDTTGGNAYNLALSEQRARAVVRYLASQHDIPLRQIHLLGAGSENPHAANSTREGRQMNRRVEVKVYVAGQQELSALK